MAGDRLPLLPLEWRPPPGVRVVATTRLGGCSRPPYDQLNLGAHCGDDPSAVAENRQRLIAAAQLPEAPRWLHQVHGTAVVAAHELPAEPAAVSADAAWTDRPGVVCAVLTADCLPVVLASADGTVVAAAHAGWRGLCAGVLEATVAAMAVAPQQLVAWLGPAIGERAFAVGPEVEAAFTAADPGAAVCFTRRRAGVVGGAAPAAGGQSAPSDGDRCYADLPGLAVRRLARLNVTRIAGGKWCTFTDSTRFFSYRRDGRCGRMATLVYRESGTDE